VSRRVSLPAEHGGYLTAAGAGLAAALVAPEPARALAVGTAVLAAFLARGVVDRVAVRKPLARWDGAWLATLALVALGAGALLPARAAALTGAGCVVLLLVSIAARRARRHRAAILEAAGMGALGASAGWAALAAGAAPRAAFCVGLVLATHAALAVPLVRTRLRKRERDSAARAVLLSLGVLAAAALVVSGLGRPEAALALAPRALGAVLRGLRPPRAAGPPSAAWIGIRETAALAAAVALLAFAL
jgi:hypothetical protein